MEFNLFQPILDFQDILDSIGKTVTVNDVPIQAVITNANTAKNPYDEKYISTTAEIKRGDLVNYNNSNWLVINQISDMRYGTKYKGLMRKCEHNINFNFEGNVLTFPVLIDSKLLTTSADKYFLLPDGTILVTLQENEQTNNIAIDQRFIKLGFAWKVTGIDKTQKGLIVLTCEQDQFNANDDIENEIADRWLYEVQHNYVLTITNGENIAINQNDTYQLIFELTDNGAVVENPELVFTSSDANVCSVDSNGLVTGVGIGTVIITASLVSDESINDSIEITVSEVVQNIYSITIEGSSELSTYATETYTAKFYNNGVEVFDQTGTWNLNNGYATITSQNGTSCTIETGNTSGVSFVLTCTLDSDDTIQATKTVEITGGFW